MSFSTELLNCLLIIFITLVNGMPQKDDTFPVLQFTNEGSNIGGFGWETGLGGLSETDGGLYANAETPWGAYAGDQLGEDNLGGGLYAGAGLISAGAEAAAGLGGDSVNPIAGNIYAETTPGGGSGPGVFLGSDVDQGGFDGIISGSADNKANLYPPVAAAASTATSTADATASGTKVSNTIHKRQVVLRVVQDSTDKPVSPLDALANVPISTLESTKTLLDKVLGGIINKT